MSRMRPFSHTPDFLTGKDISAFVRPPPQKSAAPSTEWRCTGCGSLYIYDSPEPSPAESCRSCGSFTWKGAQ